MHDALHAQKMGFASTFSLPILEDEINHLLMLIDQASSEDTKN